MNPTQEAIEDINLAGRIRWVLKEDKHGKLTKAGIRDAVNAKYDTGYSLKDIDDSLEQLMEAEQVVRSGGWFQLERDPPVICESCSQRELFHENREVYFCPVCDDL